MSTDQGEGLSSQKAAHEQSDQSKDETSTSSQITPLKQGSEPTISTPASASSFDERNPSSKRDQPSESTHPSSQETLPSTPRQVIAVSASKGPAAFFNLARKFLVSDEMCDLSALEGAIVSAVDAAHLLERSKLATITRVQTSYVTVEPKKKKPAPSQTANPAEGSGSSTHASTFISAPSHPPVPVSSQPRRGSSGRELRRARIVITVRRTESYKKWLEDNPLQAVMAGDADDDIAEGPGPHEEPTPRTQTA